MYCMDEDIACVLVSYDNQLTYEKIQDTCQVLSTRKVDYLATNLDYVCPIEFGYVPDCGAICEMLEHAVKRKPKYLGKPGTAMVDYALKLNHFSREETLVVGDRLISSAVIMPGWKPPLSSQERPQEKRRRPVTTDRIIYLVL